MGARGSGEVRTRVGIGEKNAAEVDAFKDDDGDTDGKVTSLTF